jgi:hypothetical protein
MRRYFNSEMYFNLCRYHDLPSLAFELALLSVRAEYNAPDWRPKR